MRDKEEKPVKKIYLSVEEVLILIKENKSEEMPLLKMQPKRFVAHASADPSK